MSCRGSLIYKMLSPPTGGRNPVAQQITVCRPDRLTRPTGAHGAAMCQVRCAKMDGCVAFAFTEENNVAEARAASAAAWESNGHRRLDDSDGEPVDTSLAVNNNWCSLWLAVPKALELSVLPTPEVITYYSRALPAVSDCTHRQPLTALCALIAVHR